MPDLQDLTSSASSSEQEEMLLELGQENQQQAEMILELQSEKQMLLKKVQAQTEQIVKLNASDIELKEAKKLKKEADELVLDCNRKKNMLKSQELKDFEETLNNKEENLRKREKDLDKEIDRKSNELVKNHIRKLDANDALWRYSLLPFAGFGLVVVFILSLTSKSYRSDVICFFKGLMELIQMLWKFSCEAGNFTADISNYIPDSTVSNIVYLSIRIAVTTGLVVIVSFIIFKIIQKTYKFIREHYWDQISLFGVMSISGFFVILADSLKVLRINLVVLTMICLIAFFLIRDIWSKTVS